ncbi:MAG: hypothetical protein ACFHU9_03665 [Fluviicola sp.]
MNDRSEEIKSRFQKSWVKTKQFYDDLIENYGWQKLEPLRDFVINLIDTGESDYFRSGTSVHHLILSRSVEHGLRNDQKFIRIATIEKNRFNVAFCEGGKTYREYEVQNLSDSTVTNLLKTLKETLVD